MVTRNERLQPPQGERARSNVEELWEEATRREVANDFAGAVMCWTQVIALDPCNPIAYHRRGWARAQLGDLQGEIEDWSTAIELDPSFDAAYADRAAARVAAGDIVGAALDWQRALALNPERQPVPQPLLQRLEEKMDRAVREMLPGRCSQQNFRRLSIDESFCGTSALWRSRRWR
ncbi:MAG: hypothetical protein N3C12_04245 [Candidatus Binatia bacterium]|nr:hypothetical protein [Candidatus Binatia bacterium]